MIVRPPGLPVIINSWPSFVTIVGVMLESIRFAGAASSVPPNQPLSRRQARTRVEVPHLVVQEESCAGNHNLGAVSLFQGIGQGHGVTFRINHGKVSSS